MIYIISGQTASGKTSLGIELTERLKLQRLISHTTRPMRSGETNGVEYHFITDEQLNDVRLICMNTFNTVHGPWTYGLNILDVDTNKDYIAILEASGAIELKEAMGDLAKIIYIDVGMATRKKRAYARENKKKDPEIERRFKADAVDFADFKQHADIVVKNIHKELALSKIEKFILKQSKPKSSKSKYGAKKAMVDDVGFDSKMEADYYVKLMVDKEKGIVDSFEMQVVYELHPAFVLNGKKRLPIKYKTDFVVTYADGRVEVIDIKGFETADFKIKKKMFELKYQQELICIAHSRVDGGWIDLEQLKINRRERKKKKKGAK